jgi:hypothetical protein
MFNPNDDQERAMALLDKFLKGRERFFSLKGFAGTGKTTSLMYGWLPRVTADRPVVVVAPTNKAVKVVRAMGAGAGIKNTGFGTLHQLLQLKRVTDLDTGRQSWVPDRKKMDELPYKLVCVDESSMVGLDLYGYAHDGLKKGCKVIWIGDPAQLPPVGEADSPALEQKRQTTLTKIMRHHGPIQSYVNAVRAGIDTAIPLPETRMDGDEGVLCLDKRSWLERMVDDFRSESFARNPDHVRALAWTNEVVDWGNAYIHRALYGKDAAPFQVGQTVVARDFVMRDDELLMPTSTECRILETWEDEVEGVPSWGLRVETDDNRELDIRCLDPHGRPVFERHLETLRKRARFAPTREQKKAGWSAYWKFRRLWADMGPIYYSTVHKAQGSGYSRAYIALPNILRNPDARECHRMIYTACSRASKQLIIAQP